MRISDWSSDVCSSDLSVRRLAPATAQNAYLFHQHCAKAAARVAAQHRSGLCERIRSAQPQRLDRGVRALGGESGDDKHRRLRGAQQLGQRRKPVHVGHFQVEHQHVDIRSEEHTSELQSLMRISYAVFCLKKKTNQNETYT